MQKKYGYVRVSTRDQNEERQIVALIELGISKKNIFIDKQSGKDFKRRGYKKMLRIINPGDVIFIKSIDRLGRNYEEIINQWKILTKEKQIDIVVIDMPLLDTRYAKDLLGTFISDLVLQVLSFTAETGRVAIKQNQAEGIAVAKANGVKFGRPVLMSLSEFEKKYHIHKANGYDNKMIIKKMNMSQTSFYRYLKLCKSA